MIRVRANWLIVRSTILLDVSSKEAWNNHRSRVVNVGETKDEAIAKNLVYFLSDNICKKHPTCRDEDGVKTIHKTPRYLDGGRCAMCKAENHKQSTVRRRNIKDGVEHKAEARRRAEDIKEAKALGLSLSEYLEFVK